MALPQPLAHPAPGSRPALRSKKRREPLSEKRRRRAQACLSKLELLQAEFPELSKHLQPAVDSILRQRDRTRRSDRDTILRVLEDWHETGLVIEDLVDESGLSRWEVGEVLKEIAPLVEYVNEYRPAGSSDKPRQIIRLSHTNFRQTL